MKKIGLLLAGATLIASTGANAGGFGVGVKAGTLGLGVEVNYPVSSMLSFTAGINKYSSSSSGSTVDIDYDVDLNLQTTSLLANFHPFGGSFRLTAGAMINANELVMKANPDVNGEFIIDGTPYNASTEIYSMKAAVDFNNFAPYAGIGWGHSSGSGIGFTLDIGVLMQGEPNVDFSVTGAGAVINDPNFQADLAREEANAENDIKGFDVYPVMSAGIDIRF